MRYLSPVHRMNCWVWAIKQVNEHGGYLTLERSRRTVRFIPRRVLTILAPVSFAFTHFGGLCIALGDVLAGRAWFHLSWSCMRPQCSLSYEPRLAIPRGIPPCVFDGTVSAKNDRRHSCDCFNKVMFGEGP